MGFTITQNENSVKYKDNNKSVNNLLSCDNINK